MTLADSAGLALAVTAVLAVAARFAGALTTGGAVAGAIVGACVSLGFGLPGLAVLGTFFVVGSLATRIGWEKKKARGTAEAGEGRRDAKRVLGKGGVAAAVGLYAFLELNGHGLTADWTWMPYCGALAAATADTLGTELGVLSSAEPRSLPRMRRVPTGTPGAVSLAGLLGAVLGAGLIAALGALIFWLNQPLEEPTNPLLEELTARPPLSPFTELLVRLPFVHLLIAGVVASLLESLAVGLGLRAPGFARNVLTTLAGALIGGVPSVFGVFA